MSNEIVLWTTREFPETRGPNFPCRAFRYQLKLDADGFGWFPQSQRHAETTWRDDLPEWHIRLGAWSWKSDHGWYDGPHCFRALGFIHLYWRNYSCKKCLS